MKNRLLKRQIRRYAGGMENIPEELHELFLAIERSYTHYEEDRLLLERSMDLSSNELFESNDKIAKHAKEQETILNSLKASLNTLLSLDTAGIAVDNTDEGDIIKILEALENQARRSKRNCC